MLGSAIESGMQMIGGILEGMGQKNKLEAEMHILEREMSEMKEVSTLKNYQMGREARRVRWTVTAQTAGQGKGVSSESAESAKRDTDINLEDTITAIDNEMSNKLYTKRYETTQKKYAAKAAMINGVIKGLTKASGTMAPYLNKSGEKDIDLVGGRSGGVFDGHRSSNSLTQSYHGGW